MAFFTMAYVVTHVVRLPSIWLMIGVLFLAGISTAEKRDYVEPDSSGVYNNMQNIENSTGHVGNAYLLSQQTDVSYLSIGRSKRVVDEQVKDFWKQYSKGESIRVAILDSGVDALQLDKLHVIRMADWTSENDNYDYLGHGTHIASILGSSDKDCPGVAPAVELVVHKIVNRNGLTYTSWILDALNDVLVWNVHMVCMSIGGGDYRDQPLIDKIREVVAHGIVFLAAAGNDGPLFGTHSHPSSMKEVISIGAVDGRHKIASFSSRGMTLEEQQSLDDSSLPWRNHSYNKINTENLSMEQFLEYASVNGRAKPDILVESVDIASSGLKGKTKNCIGLSGTSYGVPIMAGYLALLLSAIPVEYRLSYMNLGGVRHLLQECCIPLSNNSIYEQGMGLFQFSLAKERLIAKFGKSLVSKGIVWTPKAKEMLGAHASVYPFQIFINTSYESCAFWWPHCTFDRSGKANPPLSLNFNLVISFPLSPVFSVDAVEYVSEFGEKALWVVNEVSSLWPFVGVLKLFISFPNLADSNNTLAESSIRRMKGKFYISVSSCVGKYRMTTCVHLDWCAYRNEKRKMILWDSFHQISYPIPFVPNDDIEHPQVLDRLGDLPFTNFRNLYQRFTSGSFDMKTFSYPWTTLEKIWNDGLLDNSIVALFCVDPEEWFDDTEIDALDRLIYNCGLSFVLVAEWFNEETMNDLEFWDASTCRWWFPVVGGSNMEGINRLGRRFGFLFGDTVFDATWCTSDSRNDTPSDAKEDALCNGSHSIRYQSGNSLVFVQQGSQILFARNKKDISRIRSSAFRSHEEDLDDDDDTTESTLPVEHTNNNTFLENMSCEVVPGEDIPVFLYRKHGKGNIIVYGDSNCLDSSLSEEFSSCVEDFYQVVRLVVSHKDISRVFNHIQYIHRNSCFPSAGKKFVDSWNGTLLLPHSYWESRRSFAV